MISWKLTKIWVLKVAKFYKRLYGGGLNLPLTIQTSNTEKQTLSLVGYKHATSCSRFLVWFNREVCNRPFHGFFQLLRWTRYGKTVNTTENSALKISKIAEFESVLLKTNEGIAPQSRDILQTFVWWWACTKLPLTTQTSNTEKQTLLLVGY